MKKILFAAALATVLLAPAHAQLYWTTNGTNASWNSTNWGTSATGPFDSAWVVSSDAVFNAVSTLTNFTTTIGNITVNANTTITANGTVSSKSGGSIVDVADGITFNWGSQGRSTTANKWTKNGGGTWNVGSGGSSDGQAGSFFTLNSGTVVVSGQRAFGGTNSLLTINGGTIQSSGGSTFANTNIAWGGNFTFSGSGNDIYSGAISLGAAARTITNSATGLRTFNGAISASSASAGLTFAGTGTTTLGGTNTYTGNTTVTGGRLNLADNAQLRFTIGADGINNQLINSGGTISLDGDFVFDLSSASTTPSALWTIATGSINYGGSLGSFSVASTLGAFTETFAGSGIWTRDENAVTYQFSELTSQLNVVPEPSTYAMLALSGLGFAAHVIRRRRR